MDSSVQRASKYPEAYGPNEHRRALDRLARDVERARRDRHLLQPPDHERRPRVFPITGLGGGQ